MARKLRPLRGTTAQNNAYTGAEGEITVDLTKKTIVVHDGVTAGGNPLETGASTASAIAAHEVAANPHPQYLTETEADGLYDAIGQATAEVGSHVSDPDPHSQYLLATTAALVYEIKPGAWQTPTLLNSWANVAGYRATQYRIQGDMVMMVINLNSGTNNLLFSLPVGYRPTATIGLDCAVHDGASAPAFGHIMVAANGDVSLEHPNPVSGHSVHIVLTFPTT